MLKVALWVITLFLVLPNGVLAGTEVNLKSRSGVTQSFLLSEIKNPKASLILFEDGPGLIDGGRVIAKSGILTHESIGDQIDLLHLNTVFELYSSYHLGQVVEAA